MRMPSKPQITTFIGSATRFREAADLTPTSPRTIVRSWGMSGTSVADTYMMRRAASSRAMRLILLWIAFWGVRAPWLAQPLVGEEGFFSQIYSERPAGPLYAWYARVAGQDI